VVASTVVANTVVMAADGMAITAEGGTVADIAAVATAVTDMVATPTIMAMDTRRTTDMATIQGLVPAVLDKSLAAC